MFSCTSCVLAMVPNGGRRENRMCPNWGTIVFQWLLLVSSIWLIPSKLNGLILTIASLLLFVQGTLGLLCVFTLFLQRYPTKLACSTVADPASALLVFPPQCNSPLNANVKKYPNSKSFHASSRNLVVIDTVFIKSYQNAINKDVKNYSLFHRSLHSKLIVAKKSWLYYSKKNEQKLKNFKKNISS